VTTTDEQTEQARRFEHRFPAHRCSFRQLGLPAPIRMLGRVIENVAPIRKVAMLRYHARYLTSFDAIVVAEKTSLFLKKRDGRSGPRRPRESRSADMTYTLAADVYLGDVSSQIYEFLLRRRPCLFIDVHETDWVDDPNYLQWKAGPVITSADDLGTRLGEAVATHSEFRKVQDEIFAYSIEIGDKSSSERAARSNLQFLFDSTD
jgi:hypothetical protein